MITQWHHLAILNLTEVKDFEFNIPWIAEQLSISEEESKSAIDRLLRMGFLDYNDGELSRVNISLETPNDIPSEAIRSFHKDNIFRAVNSMENDDVSTREITSIMMPIDEKKLNEAKQKIRNFMKDLAFFLQDGEKDKVYSLNIQLFPQSGGDDCA